MPALAGEWEILPRVEVVETFTDNARSTDGGEEVDAITTVTVGVGVIGTGRRVRLNLDYDLSRDIYLDNSDLNGNRQSLLGAGNIELYEDHFFVDGSAAISEVSLRRTGVVTAGVRTASADQSRVFTYNLSPYFVRRYGGWAESELRYSLSQTMFMETDVGTTAAPPADTETREILGSIRSGRRFTRILWELSTNTTTTEGADGGASSRRRTQEISGEFLVNRHWALLARAGLEDFKDGSLDSDARGGFFWLGGVRLNPGPRSEFRLEYGRRFGGTIWSGDMSYQIGPKTSLTASYEEDIQTQTGAFTDALAGLVRDPTTGLLIDPVTGVAVDPNVPRVDFADDTFKTRSFDIAINGTRGRNSFNVSAFFVTQDFDSGGGSNQFWGIDASIDRRLRRTLDGGLQANFSQTSESRGGGGEDKLFRGTAFLTLSLSESFTGSLTYTYLKRESDFASGLQENLISLRVRKEF